MSKKITILGSTGSIGTQALEVIEKLGNEIEIEGLSAGRNIELFKKQLAKFSPKFACVESENDALELKKEFKNIEFTFGKNGLKQIAADNSNDLVLVAVSGKIGLEPTLAAIKKNIDIALANKETLVMAGDITTKEVKNHGVNLLPVDSEHSAIFQCLNDKNNLKYLKNLIITASGGPFRNSSIEEIKKAGVKEALAHPKWNMGKKITVDSATLMNKGLEVIEAHHLFSAEYDSIKVVIHPQSVVHSAIEYSDGSVIAQLGVPSMHIPIQYALTYPKRVEGIKTDSFDFVKIASLNFEPVDFEKFPCLKLAIQAGKAGGLYPVALNAANEAAVYAFLNGKISLYSIFEIVDTIMNTIEQNHTPDLEEIISFDCHVRALTEELIKKRF